MIERAKCTLCAKVESPGFYTGCMIKDGHECEGWHCDGSGNLTRDTGGQSMEEAAADNFGLTVDDLDESEPDALYEARMEGFR